MKTVDSSHARERIRVYVHRPAKELFDLQSDRWCSTILRAIQYSARNQAVLSKRLKEWMVQQGDRRDATERSALERQPKDKSWSRRGEYAQQVLANSGKLAS